VQADAAKPIEHLSRIKAKGSVIRIRDEERPLGVVDVSGDVVEEKLLVRCASSGLPLALLDPERPRLNLALSRTNCVGDASLDKAPPPERRSFRRVSSAGGRRCEGCARSTARAQERARAMGLRPREVISGGAERRAACSRALELRHDTGKVSCTMDLSEHITLLAREAKTREEGASSALRAILEATNTVSGTVHLLESGGTVMHLLAATDIPPVVLDKIRQIPVGKGMGGVAVEKKQPVTTCNLQTDDAGGIIRQGRARRALRVPSRSR